MRVYAQPCILTQGSLDLISDRAQPFLPFGWEIRSPIIFGSADSGVGAARGHRSASSGQGPQLRVVGAHRDRSMTAVRHSGRCGVAARTPERFGSIRSPPAQPVMADRAESAAGIPVMPPGGSVPPGTRRGRSGRSRCRLGQVRMSCPFPGRRLSRRTGRGACGPGA